MKEYPIFKHLIQFSNKVDAQGNYLEGAEAEAPIRPKEELRRTEERSEEKDTLAEGGQKEADEVYEGGDSQNADQKPPQLGNTNGAKIDKPVIPPTNGMNGLKTNYETNEGQDQDVGGQRNYY